MRDLNPEELETLRNGDQGWANKTAPKRYDPSVGLGLFACSRLIIPGDLTSFM